MIIQKKLDNGMRIVMEQIPYVQSVSIGIWVRAGAVDEEDTNAGISHFIEHMMFKGTTKRTPRQIAEDADRIGASMNAFTGKETTCYYIKSLASNVDRACDILIDIFTNSVFDATELNREKDVIFEEIKMVEDTPDEHISELLDSLVFRGTPYSKQVLGSVQSLTGIDRSRILEYMQQEYTIDNTLISISGNFDENRILEYFNQGMKGLSPTKSIKRVEKTKHVNEQIVKVKDVEQAHLCMGISSLPYEDPLRYPMLLMSSVFGGSMSSRLFQNIREQKGLAYSIFSASHHFAGAGIFEIFAGVSLENVEKVLKEIGKEMKLMADKGISADELAIAKEQIKSSYVFGRENVNNRMFSNGKNLLLYGKTPTVDDIITAIDQVKEDQIAQAVKLVTDLSKYSSVLICGKEYDLSGQMKEATQ